MKTKMKTKMIGDIGSDGISLPFPPLSSCFIHTVLRSSNSSSSRSEATEATTTIVIAVTTVLAIASSTSQLPKLQLPH